MSLYKITITLKAESQSGKDRTFSVIREYMENNIERIWHILENKSRARWGRTMKIFDCVLISKRSPDYKKFIKDKSGNMDHLGLFIIENQKEQPIINGVTGTGKYRMKAHE